MFWLALSNDTYEVDTIKQSADKQGVEYEFQPGLDGVLTLYFDTPQARQQFSDKFVEDPWA